MRKIFGIILLSFFMTLTVEANDRDSIYLEGKVLEQISHTDVPGAFVEVLDGKDSTLINSQIASIQNGATGNQKELSVYQINIPRKTGKFILRVSKEGYDTTCVDFLISNIQKRAYKQEVPPIFLSRMKQVGLDDVIVKATKVKFYSKGDTLVYNADAFQLAEGSMLDALIRQLPGAELRKNGQIYINGRYVDNLLLNGKDFFKGNNNIMLENLPNYMIGNIQVYDKLGDKSRFAGVEMANDKQYVLDVKLKKKYSVGLLGNIEMGGGTKERYLGRLFALRFTDHSRLSVYGNMNNLNDNRKPGENDDWKPSDLFGGLSVQQLGGFDYDIDSKNGNYSLNGNVQVEHKKTNITTNTTQKNFLSEGNTYDRILDVSKEKEFQFSTNHRLYFEFSRVNLELLPLVKYRKFDEGANYSSLTSLSDLEGISKSALDSLFTPYMGKTYLREMLNRNLRAHQRNGSSLETNLEANSTIKFKNSPDNLSFHVEANYKNESEKQYEHNLIEYYSHGEKEVGDFMNRYFDKTPNRGYTLLGKATYTYPLHKGITLYLSYQYDKNYKYSNASLFRLDRLEGWGADSQTQLGDLPSVEAYQATIDSYNSFDSKLYTDNHTVEPFLNWQKATSKGKWSGQLAIPVTYQYRKIKYLRGEVDTTFCKRTTLLNIHSTYVRWKSKDKMTDFMLSYDLTAKSPDMNMFLNIHDTTDPLNITLGNSELSNTYIHEVRSSFSRIIPKKQMMLGVEANYKISANDISMGCTYDKTTGVRQYRPSNVNGNWQGNITAALMAPLDKKRTLMLTAMLGPNYRQSVDLMGLSGMSSYRSVVKTTGFDERIELRWKIGNSSLSFKSAGTWGHISGNVPDFQNFSAVDINNGVIAQLSLPWKLKLDTDMTLYTRRGYVDQEMNSDDWVWNARLSRPFFKGKVVAMLDGFDILGKLSNVTKIMNAQALTEKYTNVIPRYIMFHVVYKFSKTPKK